MGPFHQADKFVLTWLTIRGRHSLGSNQESCYKDTYTGSVLYAEQKSDQYQTLDGNHVYFDPVG